MATFCDAILGAALSPDSGDLFARCGAMYTASVSLRTVVLLLRLRYLLHEKVDEYAEEVLLAAFQRSALRTPQAEQSGRLEWLQPLDKAPRELLEQAMPAANISQSERKAQVEWALPQGR